MNVKNNRKKAGFSELQQIREYIRGNYYCLLISLAAKLGIADLLARGARSLKELANLTNTHAPYLYRVLRALISIGVFEEQQPKMFSQTPLSEILTSDSLLSMKNTAIMCGSKWYQQAWAHIFYTVKSGKPAFDNIYGMNLFEYFNKNPDDRIIYDSNLSSITNIISKFISNSYDFSKFRTIVDLGGGQGTLLINIKKKK